MALRPWSGLIVDEQEHAYLLQWEEIRDASTVPLVPSWIPKFIVTASTVHVWEGSRAYRWKRARGDFPWSPPPLRSAQRNLTLIRPSPSSSTSSLLQVKKEASPKQDPFTVSEGKRRKVDPGVADESMTARLAMDACLGKVSKALYSYKNLQAQSCADGSESRGVEDVAMRWARRNRSLVADVRRSEEELAALVAGASKKEENNSDHIYGEDIQRKMSDIISTMGGGLHDDWGNLLPGEGQNFNTSASLSRLMN